MNSFSKAPNVNRSLASFQRIEHIHSLSTVLDVLEILEFYKAFSESALFWATFRLFGCCSHPEQQGIHGVSLLRSFSALADVADAQTKVEHRRREKEKAQSRYQPYNLNVPVVIVTSEVAPYSKTAQLVISL